MHRIPALLLLALLPVSCDFDENDIPGQQPPKGPSVGIDAPSDGAEVFSSSVWVEVRTSDFKLAPEAMGSPAVPGEGHYHVYVDGAAHGEGGADRYLVTDLSPGDHEIGVRLFDNAHQPVAGALPAVVGIHVPADAPRVQIVSPAAGSVVRSSSVELTISSQNHPSEIWQAYVDTLESEATGIGDDPTNVVTRVPAGRHTLYVRLHHGDGTPYEPEVLDKLDVEIPVDAPSVLIESPANGTTTDRFPVIRVTSQNFEISASAAGGAPQPGQGHYHVYIDGYTSGSMWQEGYWPETTLNNIPIGTRDVYVRLMNNDHTPIDPKIVDRIRIIVQ